MRVISGSLKGRIIKEYNVVGTRPTMDRVKESLFSIIQDYLIDSVCLDLFCGSGSLGIEALSNNASFCYFVDSNPKIIDNLNKNMNDFSVFNYKSYFMDYDKAIDLFIKNNIRFDIVFLDPPYGMDVIGNILNKIECIVDGIVVCEFSGIKLNNKYGNLELLKEKKYGNKCIFIYKKM